MTGKDGIPVIIDPIMLLNRGQMAKVDLEKWRVICINDPDRASKTLYKGFVVYCAMCVLAPRTRGKESPSAKRLGEKVREMGRILRESDMTAYERFGAMAMEGSNVWTIMKKQG